MSAIKAARGKMALPKPGPVLIKHPTRRPTEVHLIKAEITFMSEMAFLPLSAVLETIVERQTSRERYSHHGWLERRPGEASGASSPGRPWRQL